MADASSFERFGLKSLDIAGIAACHEHGMDHSRLIDDVSAALNRNPSRTQQR
jgi:hypothetical protein